MDATVRFVRYKPRLVGVMNAMPLHLGISQVRLIKQANCGSHHHNLKKNRCCVCVDFEVKGCQDLVGGTTGNMCQDGA